MSHYVDWRLIDESPKVKDIVGLREFLSVQEENKRPPWLVDLFESHKIVESSETREVREKEWTFCGFTIRNSDGTKDTVINHFAPNDNVLQWLAGISKYLEGKVTFIVLDEGGPRLDVYWATLVEAENGIAKATPLGLRAVGPSREVKG